MNNLVNFIEYQEGSVVSKTIINKKVGTITIFAFDKEQGLSTHSAPFKAFVQILDGEVEIIISEKSQILRAGDFIVMPADEPHSVKAITKMKMMLVMIREK